MCTSIAGIVNILAHTHTGIQGPVTHFPKKSK